MPGSASGATWRSPPLARIRNNLDLPRAYATSAVRGARDRRRFDAVETYCMFIGYPRSGHTLVGSLLDAHPEAVIANEADALRYVATGFTRSQLYSLILDNARSYSSHREHVYDYTVPGQWQGRYRSIRVIGDKKGGRSTRRLALDPSLRRRLLRKVGVPLRFIHVLRNPFDNIATIYLRTMQGRGLAAAVEEYLRLCATADQLRTVDRSSVLDVRHEDLLASPKQVLRKLCRFVGLDASDEFIDACAGILFSSPHRTREDVAWTPQLIEEVAEAVERYEFLRGYRYAE
ncbi:MAG TPA: sulfotransferase [Acidimicrobiales bacterium]|nr:sulfotransferase [Acidimicrobiales bacterium]